MSLLTLPPFLTRRKETAVEPAMSEPNVLMQFLTRGGASVELYEKAWTVHRYATPGRSAHDFDRTGFQWICRGCDAGGRDRELGWGYAENTPVKSRDEANAHAEKCRAMPKPGA
ncbi:hypothetical protein [Streptomyces sp. NPDC002853]